MIGMKAKRILSDSAIYIILTVMVVIWLFPFFFLVMQSFRAEAGAFPTSIFPETWTFDNYKLLFTDSIYPYYKWFLNTLVVAIFTCIISTMLVLMVSYALSRMKFKMRKPLMNVSMALGLFPSFMSMIAIYYIFKEFKLIESLAGLVLAYSLASGMGFYLVKGFFDTVPFAIDEAAMIDGASRNRIFWQMIIPLSKPIIIYTIITTFLGPWQDFIMVSVLIRNKSSKYTVSMGLYQFLTRELQYTYFTRFCAGAVITAVPITLLFLFMQKYYVAGIAGGAAKG